MSDHSHAEPHAPATPAPAVQAAPEAPSTPVSHLMNTVEAVQKALPNAEPKTHHNVVMIALIGDVLVGVITAMLGHQFGQQVSKMFQGLKSSLLPSDSSTQPVHTVPATHTTTEVPNERFDPTIRPKLFDIGPNDEAEMLMVTTALFPNFQARINAAPPEQKNSEMQAMQKLKNLIGYIAHMDQHQIDWFRNALTTMKGADIQARFFLGLSYACDTEEEFTNFMKAHGIIKEIPEFTTELGKGIANGFEGALALAETLNAKTRRKLAARRRIALEKAEQF
jgi:hypothetical protein